MDLLVVTDHNNLSNRLSWDIGDTSELGGLPHEILFAVSVLVEFLELKRVEVDTSVEAG